MRRRRVSAVVNAPEWVLRPPPVRGFGPGRREQWTLWLDEREALRVAAGMSEHEAGVARLVRDTAWLFAREQAAAWGQPFDREVPAL